MTHATDSNPADSKQEKISSEARREIEREADRCAYNGGRALNAVFYSQDLSPPERLLMLLLGSEMDFRGQFSEYIPMTRKTIAKRLGYKEARRIDPHITSLSERGYISVVKRIDENGIFDAQGSEYTITKRFFEDYSSWLVLQRLEHGVSLKSADYKRTDNYVELGAQPILVKNTRGGSTEFGTRGSTEFGTPFTPASSPKNFDPTVKTRVREVPESERQEEQKPEPETKNPFEPTIGNPDHKLAIAKMVEDGRNQGLMIKPDDLARSIGLAIQNLGATFPAIKEIWPFAVAGMLERLERNPATGFFNWIKADLAYKERQRQIDERQAAKSSHGKNRKNMQESMPAPNVELSEEEENLRQKKKAEMRKLLFPDKAHI